MHYYYSAFSHYQEKLKFSRIVSYKVIELMNGGSLIPYTLDLGMCSQFQPLTIVTLPMIVIPLF